MDVRKTKIEDKDSLDEFSIGDSNLCQDNCMNHLKLSHL